jgi:superfamily I DNA/RNA helicase
MPLETKIFQNFQHDHERRGFMDLSQRLEQALAVHQSNAWLLGNVMVNGAEIDAIFIKEPSTFFVLELKDYSGELRGGENGEWTIGKKVVVKGGSFDNPFHQVRRNRRVLNCRLIGTPVYNKVESMVLFTKPITTSPKFARGFPDWFQVCDQRNGPIDLTSHRGQELSFGEGHVNKFIDSLTGCSAPPPSPLPEDRKVQLFPELDFQQSFMRLMNEGAVSAAGRAAKKFFVLREQASNNQVNSFADLPRRPIKGIEDGVFIKIAEGFEVASIPTGFHEIILQIGESAWLEEWARKYKGLVLTLDQKGRVFSTTFDREISDFPALGSDDTPYLTRLISFSIHELIDNDFVAQRLAEAGPLTPPGELEGFIGLVQSDSLASLLKDLFALLSDGKTPEAQGRLDCWLGDTVPLTAEEAAVEDPIDPAENTNRLIDLSSLDADEWERFLDPAKFQEWLLMLHPNQKRFVTENFEKPVRVHGVSGSGKTSVLVHRAVRLANEYKGEKILVLTLSSELAGLIRGMVDRLANGIPENLVVKSYFSFLGGLLEDTETSRFASMLDMRISGQLENEHGVASLLEKEGAGRLSSKLSLHRLSEIRDKWDVFADENFDTLDTYLFAKGVDYKRYLWEELTLIRSVARLSNDYEDYKSYNRDSRAIRFHQTRREAVMEKLLRWEAFQVKEGFLDEMAFTQAGTFLFENKASIPVGYRFRSILVDEYQDLSTFDIKLLTHLVSPKENSLFFTGDTAQKVNAKQLSLKSAIGNDFTERRLLKNYRNSKQILRMGMAMLEAETSLKQVKGEDIELLNPEFATRDTAKPFLTRTDDPLRAAWYFAKEWVNGGNAPFTVCLVTVDPTRYPTKDLLQTVPEGLSAQALTGDYIETPQSCVIAELEQVKGFEFLLIVLIGAEKGRLPAEGIIPGDLSQTDMIREGIATKGIPQEERWRDLLRLYVGITRGRDEVRFLYKETPSPFLTAVPDELTEDERIYGVVAEEAQGAGSLEQDSGDAESSIVEQEEGNGSVSDSSEAPIDGSTDAEHLERAADKSDSSEASHKQAVDAEQEVTPVEEERCPEDDLVELPPPRNIGGINIIALRRPVTVWEMAKKLGQKNETQVAFFLADVGGGRPRPKEEEVLDLFVYKTLQKFNCVPEFHSRQPMR